MIYQSKGRVVVTGIGKSAHIASKIVATLNSTGTSSVFMHAADAIHGDLGIIQKEDIVIVLSKSGETPEIKVLVPLIKSTGNPLIAIVGNNKSYLAKQASKVLDVTIEKEACQNNLAPTTSTTAQLVMGDALAVSLMEIRGFSSRDFARFHPGGTLGKRLYMRVKDLFINNEVPRVKANESMDLIIMEISSKRLGATAVLDDEKLVGIITDGDLRRMLQKHADYRKLLASDVMTPNPRTIQDTSLVVDALTLMKENNITQLPVLKKDKYLGVIHLHDILKEGIL
ncbi:MAG: KpsF/GutQ family sugar-phosphate isomerase [Bacteroidales bacterium]|nr:KpsF/GutQ family sugar-phosphate isomerase [Bacteroidales bacterium]